VEKEIHGGKLSYLLQHYKTNSWKQSCSITASVITMKPAINTKDLKNNPNLQMHIHFQ